MPFDAAAPSRAPMLWIEVSPEMTALFGPGRPGAPPLPADPVALTYRPGEPGDDASLTLEPYPDLQALDEDDDGGFRVVLLTCRQAVLRLEGHGLLASNARAFFLPSELRTIVQALREPSVTPAACSTYRLAKCIELFCQTLRLFTDGELAPKIADSALSAADTRRVAAARQMIDERSTEKLTLDSIARACGLNRAKLTRGFREMYDCSVAEAIAARRLTRARLLLLTTDLPVACVGYESGYSNNAAFARAFGRHFGQTPSDVRACKVAA